jgi:excinuclease ABC subunit C
LERKDSAVKGLFSALAFTGFGPAALLASPPELCVVGAKRPARLREKVRRSCGRRPGVYGMVDPAGELLYVGKAKSLRARLLSYFRPNSRDPKAGRIIQSTRVIVWEHVSSEFAALLRELELIRRWRPRFNVQGQPRRHRRGYVCVGRQPAPYAFLAARPPSTALAVYGPVPAGPKAREAVRRVNDWYRLRDCPQAQEMVFADQGELFQMVLAPGCIRHEIAACTGPCAAACTQADYTGQVRSALRFLDGDDPEPLETLQREMTAASEGLAFERAAALRDKLGALRWLQEHLARLRAAAGRSCVYPVAGFQGDDRWYLVHGGRVRTAIPAPRSVEERRDAIAILTNMYATGSPAGPASLEEIDGMLLVAAWFRRHTAEQEKTFSPEAALAACHTPADADEETVPCPSEMN